MTKNIPEHERLFDEICNKLHQLSRHSTSHEGDNMHGQEKVDRLQNQIKRFQSDLQDAQQELREKIKSLESVQVVHNTDLHQQLKQLTEQLNNERGANTKLNQDLARSLELGLQLQLEIQNLKTRGQQLQIEERKYSQTLQEKNQQLIQELELNRALREELDSEIQKARYAINEKDEHTKSLTNELDLMASSFEELQESSLKQQQALRTLSEVAENKIVELKLALDRKSAESRDYESHLQQALTQNQLLRQENANLKDHISKLNTYLQETPAIEVKPTALPSPPSAS